MNYPMLYIDKIVFILPMTDSLLNFNLLVDIASLRLYSFSVQYTDQARIITLITKES